MNILTIIPARGGSKRLPGKNIKLLGGLPLLAWSINAARDSGACTKIIISTDDTSIADIAQHHGADFQGLRPAHLATDTAKSIDVVLHELNTWEENNGPVDGLMLLQPTSPFRTVNTIRRSVELFTQAEKHSVVSASPSINHPAWCFRVTQKGIEPFLGWDRISMQSQDLEPSWTINGVIYISSPRQLRTERSFLTRNTKILPIHDKYEALDIDTPEDWSIASQACAERRLNRSEISA